MKKIILLICIAALAAVSGCVNQPLPKDAWLKGVKSEINTPWGSSKQEFEEVATGTAARNATKPDVSKP